MRNPRVQAQSPDAADPVWGWGSSLALAVVVGCVYTLAAKMSLALLAPGGVAVFWPAAGVAAGTLIALGPNARWGVVAGTMVATIVANLLGDRIEHFVAQAFCLKIARAYVPVAKFLVAGEPAENRRPAGHPGIATDGAKAFALDKSAADRPGDLGAIDGIWPSPTRRHMAVAYLVASMGRSSVHAG